MRWRASWSVVTVMAAASASETPHCVAPCQADVRIVTSVNQYMLQTAALSLLIDSVATRTGHALDVYYEGGEAPQFASCAMRDASWRACGLPTASSCGCHTIDLFAVAPFLVEFTNVTGTKASVFQIVNANAAKLQRNHMRALTRKAHFIFRKVVAIYHAVTSAADETALLVWMDSDVYVHRSLDFAFVDFALRHDVATIHRFVRADAHGEIRECGDVSEWLRSPWTNVRTLPDTGVLTLNLRDGRQATRDWVTAWAGAYAIGGAATFDCLNDICVYDRLIELRAKAEPPAGVCGTKPLGDCAGLGSTDLFFGRRPVDKLGVSPPPSEEPPKGNDEALGLVQRWKPDEAAATYFLPADTRRHASLTPSVAARPSMLLEAWIVSYVTPADAAAWMAPMSREFRKWFLTWRRVVSPATKIARLREGWLAACPEAYAPESTTERSLSNLYDMKTEKQSYMCPNQTVNTSPFHTFRYVSHLKGHKYHDMALEAHRTFVSTAKIGVEHPDGRPVFVSTVSTTKTKVIRNEDHARKLGFDFGLAGDDAEAGATSRRGFASAPQPLPASNVPNTPGRTRLAVDSLPQAARSSGALFDRKLPRCDIDWEAMLLRKIFRIRAAACAASKPLELQMTGKIGVGGELSSLLKPFSRAFNEGSGFLDPPFARCPNKTMTRCLGLEPIVGNSQKAAKHKRGGLPSAISLSQSWSVLDDPLQGVPLAYAHRGLFWWTAQVLGWLVRPNDETKRRLRHIQTTWGWERGKVIGLHVRRGDTCLNVDVEREQKGRQCDPIDAYAAPARRIIERYGMTAVYVATDDEEIARDARERADELFGLLPTRIWVLDHDRSLYARGYYNKVLKAASNDAKKRDARAIMDDLFLLADTDAFVGKFTSNIARIAFALSAAQKGGDCVVPFHSLDSTWCADFGHQTGTSIYGKFLC